MNGSESFSFQDKRVLLIISGGIAAYKSLELSRRLYAESALLRVVLTRAGRQFVTPLSVAALCGGELFEDLFDLTDERDISHIQLARDSDLIIVAPASANMLARMAMGSADDLATTLLLAAACPILVAPAMNVRMWQHKATMRNVRRLRDDGIFFVGPRDGLLAEGERGMGRMAEPDEILLAAQSLLDSTCGARIPHVLEGLRVVVTSGPTHEAIDPVRHITSGSSGRQGHAIAAALAAQGADVTLVSGPVSIPDPDGVDMVRVVSAEEMMNAVMTCLPADVFIGAAAVSDWRVKSLADRKIKKQGLRDAFRLELVETQDILATVSRSGENRPRLVVGFAAETDDLIRNARDKLTRKGCDWIVANDVSGAVMGADENQVFLLTSAGMEEWPRMGKDRVACALVRKIAAVFDRSEFFDRSDEPDEKGHE